MDKRTKALCYEIQLDPKKMLPTLINVILTADMKDGDEDFRSEYKYNLSEFGSVTEMDIPRGAAKFLR